jgi:hypothetical protein
MNSTKRHFFSVLILCVLFASSVYSQSQERPEFVTVTTIHWNLDLQDFSMDAWKAVEKEYFDKVTSKNEFIVSSLVLLHFFTADNSEIKLVSGYSSWENIEKASARSDELAKEAWPDKDQRTAFFNKQLSYYTNMHSDEIHATLPFAKVLTEKSSEPLVYYVRISHIDYPEGGTQKEIGDMMTDYVEKVIKKNTTILGYYPNMHSWGADGRDFIEAFVLKSLGDVEKSQEETIELEKTAWPDEAVRKAHFDKMGKYFTGFHADFFYRSVPELTK